ncbi:MAG: biotin--[acetyl-CoA-carboxylase] ligase [Saccharospirillaceae bacterium]|nr:biotin--[acetyl-CoA-carboxylase] ligase [Pseudomonadales bacterium]NRB81852.1 biotin--[acetyl-CoA-carboxylase] ligase [Saccharospirillaceae bacterium]
MNKVKHPLKLLGLITDFISLLCLNSFFNFLIILMHSHYRVLKQLSHQKFNSGEKIGKICQVTKAMVWKSVEKLRKLGIDVIAVNGRGYKLAQNIILLDSNEILSHIHNVKLDCLNVSLSETSTNSVLLEQKNTGQLNALITEHQSSGRGRRGKVWVSPIAKNIYMSLCTSSEELTPAHGSLSIQTGLAVAGVLKQYIPNIQLKWPNDLWVNQHKIGGILVDVKVQANGDFKIVFGLGLNVNVLTALEKVDQPWTSICQLLGQEINRNILAAQLIDVCGQCLINPSPDFSRWDEFDALKSSTVNVFTASDKKPSCFGEALGINSLGNLLVQVEGESSVRELTGGEVSIRVKQ